MARGRGVRRVVAHAPQPSEPARTEWRTTVPTMEEIDISRPHEARVYDYILGGKDNYAADRETGEQLLRSLPWMAESAKNNRAFLKRTVRFVVDAGVDQFLDIGTGLPTVENTHEVAQASNPEARVVYVDYDPLVLAHARALLTGGGTAYIHGDIRQPSHILDKAAAHLDFERPVAVMLVAILHHLLDADAPFDHVGTLIDAVPSGSYLILTHASLDFVDPEPAAELEAVFTASGIQFQSRTRGDLEHLVAGLEVMEPGIVPVTAWRPDVQLVDAVPSAKGAGHWGVVARKP
jgi:SAM-dependent methyltransferase